MRELLYREGSGLLLTTSGAALLLAAPVEAAAVDALLTVLRADEDPLQDLLTILCGGPIDLSRLPAFALLVDRTPAPRLLLRGAVGATVDDAHHTGVGTESWREVPVQDGAVIALDLPGVGNLGTTLPIVEGAVRAGHVGTTRRAPTDAAVGDVQDLRPAATLAAQDDYDHLFLSRMVVDEPQDDVKPDPVRPVASDADERPVIQEPTDDPGHLSGTIALGDHDGRTVWASGGTRPPWGIEVSTGERVALGPRTLIGRRPVAPLAHDRERVRLVRVPSPSSDISRNHVEITSNEGRVRVRDLSSTNGTVLVRLGVRRRIQMDETVGVEAEDVLDLGDGVTIRFVVEP